MWLLSMLRAIPRDECAMDFCCKGAELGQLAPQARERGAKLFHCPLGPDHARFARQLRQIIVRGQYDLVHNHLEVYSALPVWLSRQLRIPVITSFHNTERAPQMGWAHLPVLRQLRSVYGWANIHYAVRYSDLVTGCSQGVLRSLPLSDAVPSRVLYYGTEVPPIASNEERQAWRASFGWPPSTPVVLHVGRLIEQKNHGGLLRIMKEIVEKLPGARVLIVGDGPLRDSIEQSVRAQGLGDVVRLLGVRDDVPSLMSQSDLLLLPSLYEGFGLVALEANAAGLPVIGSNIPGLAEAIVHGETGLLFDVADLAGMAAAAVRVLQDDGYAHDLARAGRERVRCHFSVESSAMTLREIYRSVATRKAPVSCASS